MKSRVLRASPLSIGIAAVIVAVSVIGFALTKHSADQQEKSLLASDASQAALYVTSVFSNIGTVLDSAATAVTLSNGSPTVFVQQTSRYSGELSMALAHRQGDGWVVLSSNSSTFTTGQQLSPAVAGVLDHAGATANPGPVAFSGKRSTVGFSVGAPLVPAGIALYMQFSLPTFVASPVTSAKPFAALRVALYGSSSAQTSSLVVATTDQLPIRGASVTEHATIGKMRWTLVAAARERLTGAFAGEAPFIFLGLGLILALVIGVTVEILDRRHRYASEVVAERTADLNQSLEDLRAAQAQLVRGERLTALGEMATIVGHELRNPLAAVTNALYLLRRTLGEPAEPPLERHLAMAERETSKAAALAEDLTAFVRPRIPNMAPMEVESFVAEVVEATPPPPGVALAVDVTPMSITADRRQMAEVLANLMTNAYQAVGEHGSVRVSVQSNGAGAVMTVEDSGPGLDKELADRVFEPFFTTKHDGTGLGLAIVRRLVEAHGGGVDFEPPSNGSGARVVVHIPDPPTDGAP